MNETPRHELNEDRLLDLLVDGELTEDERRALLAKLDHEQDGWRRCALRFIENQCLEGVFGKLAASARPIAPPPADEQLTRPRASGGWVGAAGSYLAMAASVMVAFLIGVAGRDAYLQIKSQGQRGLGGSQIANDGRMPATTFASHGGTPWGSLKLELDDGALAPRQIEVPVVESPSGMSRYLTEGEPALPTNVERELRRSGHTVERQRRLVPFDLEDGRRVVVPVDEVQVQPVRLKSYQ